MNDTVLDPEMISGDAAQHFAADRFPTIHPIHWLTSHFAVGGWSPLQRLSGMLTAHMTRIAPHNGFTWHPHRGLEIYTWVLEGQVYHEDTTGGSGTIGQGEIQRMFSGDYIEHQELNPFDDPARVIQIWYVADHEHRQLDPHYQQVGKTDLPTEKLGDAELYALIGGGSPMEQHMVGRLTAATIDGVGTTHLIPPEPGEDLFLYITDGEGEAAINGGVKLGQYDVILANPAAESLDIRSSSDEGLHYLNFYLPSFLPT